MAKQKPYLGPFEGMEFPDYEYQHYPLMMKAKTGSDYRIVNDEEEQKAAEDEGFVAPKVGPPANVTVQEVDELKAQNAEKTKDLADAEAEVLELKKQLAALKGK